MSDPHDVIKVGDVIKNTAEYGTVTVDNLYVSPRDGTIVYKITDSHGDFYLIYGHEFSSND